MKIFGLDGQLEVLNSPSGSRSESWAMTESGEPQACPRGGTDPPSLVPFAPWHSLTWDLSKQLLHAPRPTMRVPTQLHQHATLYTLAELLIAVGLRFPS